MNSGAKLVQQVMQEEMVGVLMAISIVSKRLASGVLQLDDLILEDNTTLPSEREGMKK